MRAEVLSAVSSDTVTSYLNFNEIPTRSKASPRSSSSASVYSRPSDETSPESGFKPYTTSSSYNNPIRATATIFDAGYQRTSPSTWNWPSPSFADPSDDSWRERLAAKDFSTKPEEILDSILEPCPKELIHTMTEILLSPDSSDCSMDFSGFGGHRDTFAMLGLSRSRRSIDLPFHFFQRLVEYIDFETYLSARLCCRSWSKAISHARPLRVLAVAVLPDELLVQIYTHLSPVDFNAARHTCRSWMMASLEWELLTVMLKRGNWWAAAEADMAVDEALGMERLTLSDEWLLSKRLSTECSLRADWTGDGFRRSSVTSAIKLYDNRSPPTATRHNPNSLTLVSKVDFSELTHVYSMMGLRECTTALGFTVSVYNKFLLVHEDCTIYVYTLKHKALSTVVHNGVSLEFMTSIICPYPVLAVSMDTSYERFAVAALLEGRMSLIYNLYNDVVVRRRPTIPWRPAISKSETLNNPDIHTIRPYVHRAIEESDLPEVGSNSTGRTSRQRLDSRHNSSTSPNFPTESAPTGIPRRLLSNLCSPSSPPLSIAICPKRRCVAFGSATGIEIHWADALSGQLNNRHYSITSCSEVLHFMPPRLGGDLAKEFRLITSAKNVASSREAVNQHFPSRTGTGKNTDVEMKPDFDQAIPLSDGRHLLFTYPRTGQLSLGHEVPASVPGETNLRTRAVFLGPRDKNGEWKVPKIYKAAVELSWGVRIVVGYENAVWLFSVPPDLFFSKIDCMKCGDGYDNAGNCWPLRVQGIEVGTIQGLIEVAIDADGGGITIWAFGAEGKAQMYQLGDGRRREVRRKLILCTGEVVDEQDSDGDVYMRGTEAPVPIARADTFDSPSPIYPARVNSRGFSDPIYPGRSKSWGFSSPNLLERINSLGRLSRGGSFAFPSAGGQALFYAAGNTTKITYFDEPVPVSHFTAAGPLPLLPIPPDNPDTVMLDAPPVPEDEGYVSDAGGSDVSMPNAPAYGEDDDDDEGYVSAKEEQSRQTGGIFGTTPTPRTRSREDGGWMSDYMGVRDSIRSEGDGGERATGDELDVLGEPNLELEILGG